MTVILCDAKAHERGERLDERTILALWAHAHE